MVRCSTCANFTPDSVNPDEGVGKCAAGAWRDPRASYTRGGVMPPTPHVIRLYCRSHRTQTTIR